MLQNILDFCPVLQTLEESLNHIKKGQRKVNDLDSSRLCSNSGLLQQNSRVDSEVEETSKGSFMNIGRSLKLLAVLEFI